MHTWTPRVPPPRWTTAVFVALGVLYAVAMVGLASDAGALLAEGARFGFGLLGLLAAIRASRLPHLPPRLRQAWGAVAACFAVLVVSVPAVLLLDRGVGGDTADDVTHVLFVVALLIALQRFPLAPMNRRDRCKTALDALTVLVGGSMVLWYTPFDPLAQSSHLTADVRVSAVLYPVCGLALLFSASLALLRGADASARRPLRLLTAAALVLFLGDAVTGYLHAHHPGSHVSWQYFCWLTTDALLAAAAVVQSRPQAPAGATARRRLRPGQGLPFLAIVVAHALMLDAAVKSGNFAPWGGLALGGALLSALVLSRQTLVQRESDEQALTDGLTGLANRTRFRETSLRGLARGARTGRHTAILLIDMNGFKGINDTLGHQAGDLVLVEFAEVLRHCVTAPGLPARLGGDEFAVVLTDLDSPRQAYDVAGRIAAALGPVAVDGRLVTLAASVGVAVSGPGELRHDVLAHRADQAMYKAKGQGPATRWAVWQESMDEGAGARAA
ncbi:GGDEF domain-containing protein [Actinoplanes sp. DH11]|uniref:GGDEF domain-containing protein n=1 Tax=Actinoplanes sp. DH11 TaxID=2857011 RepID=UPI001E389791|nr:GGDEF domain-containing protein [Actinoplanes sp. DH11]